MDLKKYKHILIWTYTPENFFRSFAEGDDFCRQVTFLVPNTFH